MRRPRKQRLNVSEASVSDGQGCSYTESTLQIAETSELMEPKTLTRAVRFDLVKAFYAIQAHEAQNGQPIGSVDDSPQVAIERIFKEEPDYTPQPLPRIIRNGHKHNGNKVDESIKARHMAALVTDTAEVIMEPLRTLAELNHIPSFSPKIPGEPLL